VGPLRPCDRRAVVDLGGRSGANAAWNGRPRRARGRKKLARRIARSSHHGVSRDANRGPAVFGEGRVSSFPLAVRGNSLSTTMRRGIFQAATERCKSARTLLQVSNRSPGAAASSFRMRRMRGQKGVPKGRAGAARSVRGRSSPRRPAGDFHSSSGAAQRTSSPCSFGVARSAGREGAAAFGVTGVPVREDGLALHPKRFAPRAKRRAHAFQGGVPTPAAGQRGLGLRGRR